MDLLLPNYALLYWTILMLLFFIFSLVAIISITSAKNTDGVHKLMWVIVVLFVPFFGSLLYFIMGRKRNNIKLVQ